jgi:hypothetical protein
MTPERLTRPSVGFSPTSELAPDGQTMEPSVSVPTPTAAKLDAMAAPVPELEPHGLRSVAYGFRHWPPRPLQPETEWLDRKFAHSEREGSGGRHHPIRGGDVVFHQDRNAVQRTAHAVCLALRIEPVSGGKSVGIRFDHRVELGVELGDAGEVGCADRMGGARAGTHRVLQLRHGRLFQLEIGSEG